jgi:hypothetical protein
VRNISVQARAPVILRTDDGKRKIGTVPKREQSQNVIAAIFIIFCDMRPEPPRICAR